LNQRTYVNHEEPTFLGLQELHELRPAENINTDDHLETFIDLKKKMFVQ
jgi:hypothetical protein